MVEHHLIRARQRLRAVLEAFTSTAESLRQLPHLANLCRQISDRLQTRWRDMRPLDLFPIFQPAP